MKSIPDKNWPALKAKIRNKWGKFSDQELNTLKSDITQLRGKIQKAYGLSAEHAEYQYEEFKTAVFVLLSAEAPKSAVAAAPEPLPAKTAV